MLQEVPAHLSFNFEGASGRFSDFMRRVFSLINSTVLHYYVAHGVLEKQGLWGEQETGVLEPCLYLPLGTIFLVSDEA